MTLPRLHLHLQNNSKIAIHKPSHLSNTRTTLIHRTDRTTPQLNLNPNISQSQSQHIWSTILIQSQSQQINPQTHIQHIKIHSNSNPIHINKTQFTKFNTQTQAHNISIHKLKFTTQTNMSYRTSIKPISCITDWARTCKKNTVFQNFKIEMCKCSILPR